jgi:hypothetical protein
MTLNSIRSWVQLERQLHEQFYGGKVRIVVIGLANIKRRSHESIDEYLCRFWQLKSRCSAHIPELELVKMAINDLDYQVKKKGFGSSHSWYCTTAW